MLLVLPPPTVSAAPGDTVGSTFSDLYIILRTENGVPIPSGPFQEVSGPVTCVSSIAVIDGAYADIPGIPSTLNPVDGRLVDLVPLQGNAVTNPARTILPPGEDSMITPLTPVRFADTRPGWVAADGLFYGTGTVPAGGVVQVQIAGRGAVPVGAKAVVANVTLVNAAAAGFATVFPRGTVPDASSVNYLALTNEAVANEVLAKLSPTGSICVYTYAAANVLVDVVGHL